MTTEGSSENQPTICSGFNESPMGGGGGVGTVMEEEMDRNTGSKYKAVAQMHSTEVYGDSQCPGANGQPALTENCRAWATEILRKPVKSTA